MVQKNEVVQELDVQPFENQPVASVLDQEKKPVEKLTLEQQALADKLDEQDALWQRIEKKYPRVPDNMKIGYCDIVRKGMPTPDSLQLFCQGVMELAPPACYAPSVLVEARPDFVETPVEQWNVREDYQTYRQKQFIEAAKMIDVLRHTPTLNNREFFLNLRKANPVLVQYIDEATGRYQYRHGLN